jgi:hypothetical protein
MQLLGRYDFKQINFEFKSRRKKLFLDKASVSICGDLYRGAAKSLPRPGRKQATATEDFGVHVSYL